MPKTYTTIQGDMWDSIAYSQLGDVAHEPESAAKASNKTVISTRLDSSALKAQAPDIFARFSKSTCYKRFTVI